MVWAQDVRDALILGDAKMLGSAFKALKLKLKVHACDLIAAGCSMIT